MFKLHHIDIWVNNIVDSLNFYQALGFKKINEFDNIEENKKIILLELNNVLLEMKYHYKNNCEHNKVNCSDNKVFGLSVDNINNAKLFIESKKLTSEKITIKTGILGNEYFLIHDPNGILIEFIQDCNYSK